MSVLLFGCSCSISSVNVTERCITNRVVLGNYGQENIFLPIESFVTPNTKYIVRGNCILNGQKMKVGNNCEIVIDGGRLCNGEIVGNDTFIRVKKRSRSLCKLAFSGTFLMPTIKTDYFEIDETTLCDMFDLTSEHIKNKIYINDNLSATIPYEWQGAVVTKSYTDVYINAIITLNTCSFKGGNVFYIRDCHDVTISGLGHIVGDLLSHAGEDGECVYGIFIRNAEKITVKSVTCELFWGDGIYIYPGPAKEECMPTCRNIVVDGVTCNSNRRQGMSIVGGENIVIKNSKFINTGLIRGTAPSSGVDIEPAKGLSVDNITIVNCEFENNGHATNYPADLQVINNYGKVKIRKCKLNDFFYGCADNIEIEDCVIAGRLYSSSNGIGKNVNIIDSKLGTIHNNLIKNGNVNLIHTTVGK